MFLRREASEKTTFLRSFWHILKTETPGLSRG